MALLPGGVPAFAQRLLPDRLTQGMKGLVLGAEGPGVASPNSNAALASASSTMTVGKTIFEQRYWIGHINTSPTRSGLLACCYSTSDILRT